MSARRERCWCVVDSNMNQRINVREFTNQGAAEFAAALNKPIGRARYVAARSDDYPLTNA